jgi:hypothetical protein
MTRDPFWDYYDTLLIERRAAEQSEAEPPEFELLQTRLPLGDLPSTPKRVLKKAREAGFTVEGYEARVRYHDTYLKTGENKGELKRAGFDQRNIFLGGHEPTLRVRFYAAWLGSKFSAHIYDPIGRFMYANSRQADERETYWMEKSSRAFETWLTEWASTIWHMKSKQKEAA